MTVAASWRWGRAGLGHIPVAALAAEAERAAEAARPAGRYLSARKRGGRDETALLDESGRDLRVVPMPARGHSFAIDAAGGRAVVFGRQPGFFALGFGLGAAGPVELDLPQDRHFFGHGAFFDDGRLLAATENDFDGGRGVLGIYDASAGGAYRRVGEFDCGGIGPHEVLLLPDGKTLCVANGGILTHPDYGKLELNLDTMRPSLAYLDAASGKLLERWSWIPRCTGCRSGTWPSRPTARCGSAASIWVRRETGPRWSAAIGAARRRNCSPAPGCLAPDAQLHRLGRGGRGRRGGGHV